MKRKKFLFFSTVAILLCIFALAAFAGEDIDQHRDCRHCGMDRKAYGYSRMLVEYKDGKNSGNFSLDCAVTELNGYKGVEVITFKVADRDTRQLIVAEKAFWVIGGSKRGVMTRVPKWAFSDIAGANKFVAAYGGIIVNWESVLAAAKKETAGGTH